MYPGLFTSIFSTRVKKNDNAQNNFNYVSKETLFSRFILQLYDTYTLLFLGVSLINRKEA